MANLKIKNRWREKKNISPIRGFNINILLNYYVIMIVPVICCLSIWISWNRRLTGAKEQSPSTRESSHTKDPCTRDEPSRVHKVLKYSYCTRVSHAKRKFIIVPCNVHILRSIRSMTESSLMKQLMNFKYSRGISLIIRFSHELNVLLK